LEKKMVSRLGWFGAVIGMSAALGAAVAPSVAQQDFPNRPMRVLIGFPAGSGADILGRYFTTKLQEVSGQSVVVENKPGANSNIAVGLVANAKPDGYTMLFVANSNMAGSRRILCRPRPSHRSRSWLWSA
jgi:tripartite-type tricarboxylate transporter receptor subunit TctC